MKRRSQGIRRPDEVPKSKRGVFPALIVTTALIAASCGGSSEATADAGAEASTEIEANTETGTEAAVASASFPDTEVLSLNDGATVQFDELVAGGDAPVLLWFYYPH